MKKQNNTVYTKKSDLDQFYTSEKIARECYNKVTEMYGCQRFDIFFESSAGTGSFFNLFPKSKRLGIDLDSQCDGVEKQNFFEFVPPTNKTIVTIGNPPFGKNSSLAVKFFNTAAEFSDVIAFIIPKTFRKKSLQKRLHLNFHLKLDIDLPKDSFILNGEPYDVPCCFQIWEQTSNKRRIQKVDLENNYFNFTKKDDADLAVRRVGGRTGKATKDIAISAEVSHYFLKLKDQTLSDWLLEQINNINFTKIINSTAGVKSLSKPEFVTALLKAVQ
jgi:predicted RNA methylase